MCEARFERDVSATQVELAAWIAKAYPAAVRLGEGRYLIETPTAALRLEALAGPERRIALLRLPTLHIRYEFIRGEAEQRAALLHRLDLFMHRGGG